ncbi:MAG: hypothetical protein JNK74_05345 [Candidatus Hydrogenedentes bacterium]|nr:hypothetical protein [Candidatus Hydrogenedentota bacterium]
MMSRIAGGVLLALIALGVLQNFAAHLYHSGGANLSRSVHQGMELGVPFLVPLALLCLSRKRSLATWLILYGTVVLMIASATYLYCELFLDPDRKRLYFLDVYLKQWLLAGAGLIVYLAIRAVTAALRRYGMLTKQESASPTGAAESG